MHVINALGVNDAYSQGLALLRRVGVSSDSRAGPVLVALEPVATVYQHPKQRVLLDPVRDANPFFHLFESLWMLSGRNDARWLDRFVRDFSSRFAEDDGHQHGAYGFRWRRHFDVEGGGAPGLPDQIETVVRLLRANPEDRRIVLTMWDPAADLDVARRDIPCNTHAYLRVRQEPYPSPAADWYSDGHETRSVLDLTVCCRSNDAIWGCYGANAVHFSVLQEYLAGRLGVGVGTYTQISNNFHAYVDALEKVGEPDLAWRFPYGKLLPAYDLTCSHEPLGQDWDAWDADLARFMAWTELDDVATADGVPEFPRNPWFFETATPLFVAATLWRRGDRAGALALATFYGAMAPDWRIAAQMWFERRMKT